jgi:hypothetical protein
MTAGAIGMFSAATGLLRDALDEHDGDTVVDDVRA